MREYPALLNESTKKFDFFANPVYLDIVSFLSDEIDRQLAASNQSVDDLVAKCNLTRSLIYLWKTGGQTSIAEAQLTALANALSDNVGDHAALVIAHLRDETFGPGSELVQVNLSSISELKDRPQPRSKGEHALHFLAELRVRSRDVNDLVIDLARCLGAEI